MFLCGLAAAYLALITKPQSRIIVVKNKDVSTQHANKQDIFIKENIKEIVKPVLPHLNDHEWLIKAIEHHGPHAYVLADALGKDKGEGTYKFVVKLGADSMETLGVYSFYKDRWKLVYGKDPILSNKDILKE